MKIEVAKKYQQIQEYINNTMSTGTSNKRQVIEYIKSEVDKIYKFFSKK